MDEHRADADPAGVNGFAWSPQKARDYTSRDIWSGVAERHMIHGGEFPESDVICRRRQPASGMARLPLTIVVRFIPAVHISIVRRRVAGKS